MNKKFSIEVGHRYPTLTPEEFNKACCVNLRNAKYYTDVEGTIEAKGK